MSRKEDNSSFWNSYSDLMTSMFFVMLVLFVLTIAILHKQMVKIEEERRATQEQLDKIRELEESIKNIDTTYFAYDSIYKTHILQTEVFYPTGKSAISYLSEETQAELCRVRDVLRDSLVSFTRKTPGASYFLIIEGQASRDKWGWYNNSVLSYNRALELFRFWFPNQNEATLSFFDLPCEVIIAGAGFMEGKPRDASNEKKNQRFLIRILPKPGLINESVE